MTGKLMEYQSSFLELWKKCLKTFYRVMSTVMWTNDLLKLGYKHKLNSVDIYEVLPQDSSIKLANDLGREWEKEVYLWKSGGTPSLSRALRRCYGNRILGIGTIFFLVESLRVTQALFLGLIMSYFTRESSVPQTGAFLYAFGWTMACIFATALDNIGFHTKHHYGMKMRVAITSLVFRKVLKLSHNSLNKSNTSTILNTLTTDAQTFDQLCLDINYMWIAPLEAVAMALLLWYHLQLGPYSMICVGTVIALSPIQFFIGRRVTRLRSEADEIANRRIHALNDVTKGILSIKINCWEKPFSKMINTMWRNEWTILKSICHIRALNSAIFFVSGKGLLLATLLTFVLLGNKVTASVLFTSMAFVEILRSSVTLSLPWGLQNFINARTVLSTVQELLCLGEKSLLDGHSSSLSRHSALPNHVLLSIENYSSMWSKDSGFPALIDINMDIAKGQHVVLTGPSGSGKSALLLSITGELQKASGSLCSQGKISYAPQRPWIFAGTIRENILFGLELNRQRYNKILNACGLVQELESLSNGDITIIDEDNSPLSKIQKIKISLARAVYRRADLYLIDDVFSSLDDNSASHIFNKCVCALLSKKAVLLVTNRMSCLPAADLVICIEKGRISQTGTFKDLKNKGVTFDYDLQGSEVIKPKTKLRESKDIEPQLSRHSSTTPDDDQMWMEMESEGRNESDKSHKSSTGGWTMMWRYFMLGGGMIGATGFIVLCVIVQFSFVFCDWWLYLWTQGLLHGNQSTVSLPNATTTISTNSLLLHLEHLLNGYDFKLLVYIGLIVFLVIASFLRASSFTLISVRSSRMIHLRTIRVLLRAPIAFFSRHSNKDIMQYLTRDLAFADDHLPAIFFDCIQFFCLLLGATIMAVVMSYWMLLVIIPLLAVFLYAQHYYAKTARQIESMVWAARQPVIHHVSSTIRGLWTIRAFLCEDQHLRDFDAHQDRHTAVSYLQLAAVRWFTLRLDILSVLFVGLLAFVAVATKWAVNEGLLGLCLVYALNSMGVFQYSVRQSTELLSQMQGMRNVFRLAATSPEPDAVLSTQTPKWPQYGIVTFEGVTVPKRSGKVLRNIWCCFRAEEKVGVVSACAESRKGIVECMMRLCEDSTGTVRVDGIDISGLRLNDLRRKISVIMEKPYLFSTSIRRHLDPGTEHPDAMLWKVLDDVQLKKKVSSLSGELYADIKEWEYVFDVGDLQLLAMARALLNNSKIVIYEETTTNLDQRKKNLLNLILNTKFQSCTVITLATDIKSVMQCDRTMVIEDGRVREFDPPYTLLLDSKSSLYHAVHKLAPETVKELVDIAKDKFENRAYEAPPTSLQCAEPTPQRPASHRFLPIFQSNRLTGVFSHFSGNRFSTNRY